MGWRDFQMPHKVKEDISQNSPPVHNDHYVHKESVKVSLSGYSVLSVQGDGIENRLKHSPTCGKSIDEVTKLFKERGWIQIWAGYLNQHIYLVRDEEVKVPDPALSKYTQAEIEALKDLSMEEIQTLHEAKIIFKGIINDKNP